MLSDAMLSALSQPNVSLVYLAEFHYLSGVSRVHSQTGELRVHGEIFYGTGQLGHIAPIAARGDLSATRVKLTLGGLDAALIKIALDEKSVGRRARIYLGVLTPQRTVAPVEIIFSGKIASQTLTTGQQNHINITLSNRFEDWQRPRPERMNHAAHRARFPQDGFYQFIDQMADRPIYWGSQRDAPRFVRK